MRPDFFPNDFHQWEQEKLFDLWSALLSVGTLTDLCLYLNEYMASKNSSDVKECAVRRSAQYLLAQSESGVPVASLCHQVWSTCDHTLTTVLLDELNKKSCSLNNFYSDQMMGVFSRHLIRHHFDFTDIKDVFAFVLQPSHNINAAQIWVRSFVEASLILHPLKSDTLNILSKYAPLTKEGLMPWVLERRMARSQVLEGIVDHHPQFSEYLLEQCHEQIKNEGICEDDVAFIDILMCRHPDHDITKQWMSLPNACVYAPRTFPLYEKLVIASQMDPQAGSPSFMKKKL